MKKSNRKIVSLSVHKNNREQRRRHQIRKELVEDAKIMGHHTQVDGYLILGWNNRGGTAVTWSVGDLFEEDLLPDIVRTQILRKLSIRDRKGGL